MINKELQKFFRPLNILQTVSFCPKFRIKNDVIVQNGRKEIAFCIFGNFVIISMWLYRIIFTKIKPEVLMVPSVYTESFDLAAKINLAFCCSGFFINVFINITQGSNNVKLVSMLQNILNIVKIDENIFDKLIFWNWTWIIVIFIEHCIFHVAIPSFCHGCTIISIVSDIPLLSYEMNIVYLTRLSVLITRIVQGWKRMVKNNYFIADDDFCKKMFDTYLMIKNSCVLLNNVFQDLVSHRYFILLRYRYILYDFFWIIKIFLQMLYAVITALFHSLVSIQSWISVSMSEFAITGTYVRYLHCQLFNSSHK